MNRTARAGAVGLAAVVLTACSPVPVLDEMQATIRRSADRGPVTTGEDLPAGDPQLTTDGIPIPDGWAVTPDQPPWQGDDLDNDLAVPYLDLSDDGFGGEFGAGAFDDPRSTSDPAPYTTWPPYVPAAGIDEVPADLDDIDLRYVQGVIDELDHKLGRAWSTFRVVGTTDDPLLVSLLFDVYVPALVEHELHSMEWLRDEIIGLALDPPVTAVLGLATVRRDCISFTAIRELGVPGEPFDPTDAQSDPILVGLVIGDATEQARTPWRIASDPSLTNQDPTTDPCLAS